MEEKHLLPEIRLFLSADIVGSTALKQSGDIGLSDWVFSIKKFYISMSKYFNKNWNARKADYFSKKKNLNESEEEEIFFGEQPEFWKVVGDEILFSKKIDSSFQVVLTIACWKQAIEEVKQDFKMNKGVLDIRCTAWTAGFPVSNKKIVVGNFNKDDFSEGDYDVYTNNLLEKFYKREISREGYYIDYVGPSMDVGFRIASLSNHRRMAVSVDVAYIVSCSTIISCSRSCSLIPNIPLYFSGSTSLKGVIGGRAYPNFWIDMAGDQCLAKGEDKLNGLNECNALHVHDFCNLFYREYAKYMYRPFIRKCSDPFLSVEPKDYECAYQKLLEKTRLAKDNVKWECNLDGVGGENDMNREEEEKNIKLFEVLKKKEGDI